MEEQIIAEVLKKFEFSELFDYQSKVLLELKSGNSIFVSQRTGRGKSLCYQAYTTATKSKDAMVLVFSPLLAIAEEQVGYLNSLDIAAVQLGKDSVMDNEAKQGKFQYMYGAPELLLGNDDWRETLKSSLFKEKVQLIAVDESHLVTAWGEKKKGEVEAFRPWYARIGEVRSLLPTVPLLALTATASSGLRIKIKSKLNISHCLDILDNPDRENIKLFVLKVSAAKTLEDTFHWLIKLIETPDCPRMLVFCKTISDASNLYNACRRALKRRKCYQMYHSMTPQEVKDAIAADMSTEDGQIRVLFCTNAAGMGVNYKGVQYVINYGPPQDMDTFMQQLGRAGRDGTQATHLLLYNGRQLRNLSPEMLKYVKTTTCRRQVLLEPYNGSPNEEQPGHLCCDICDKDCHCTENCEEELSHPAFTLSASSQSELSSRIRLNVREVGDEVRGSIKTLLLQYRESVTRTAYDELTHGINAKSIAQIVSSLQDIVCPADILDYSDIWDVKHATEIFDIITAVLDITLQEEQYVDDDEGPTGY